MAANDHGFYIEEHAVLYALMVRAARACGVAGEAASIEATKRYGLERGGRMRQRALRDGRDLSMKTYTQYGEWVDSKGHSANKVVAIAPTYITETYKCGWSDAWNRHDLIEDGKLYCEYIDFYLVKGFNPDNQLILPTTVSHGDPVCHFEWVGVSFESDEAVQENARIKASMADRNLKDFLYHTAHLFASMRATFTEMLGEERAGAIAASSLDAFADKFGKEKLNALLEAAKWDFSTIDEPATV